MEVVKTSWNSIEPEAMSENISRKYVNGEKVMIAQIRVMKGAVVPEHSHENEQISWILEGELLFEIEGKRITVGKGEMIVIPSGVPHKATALQDTIDVDVFSPIREDWLRQDDQYLRGK